MTLDDGRSIEADKAYRVAGWASVNPQQGKPVGDVLAGYLRREKIVRPKQVNRVTLKGICGQSRDCRSGVIAMARASTCARVVAACGCIWVLSVPSAIAADLASCSRERDTVRQSIRRTSSGAAAFRQRRQKTGPRHQRRQQSLEVLWPGPDRDRGRDVRSRDQTCCAPIARTANSSTVWWRRACASMSA